MDHQVYMQERFDGSYYIGRHNGKNPNYVGSGVSFNKSYKEDPDAWSKQIIASDLTANQAIWLERCTVGYEVVADPMSHNNMIGGCGRGTLGMKHSDKTKALLSEYMKANPAKQYGKDNPMFNKIPWNKGKVGAYGWSLTEEQKEKHRGAMNGMSKSISIEGIMYATMKQASKETGISLYHLRKLSKLGGSK